MHPSFSVGRDRVPATQPLMPTLVGYFQTASTAICAVTRARTANDLDFNRQPVGTNSLQSNYQHSRLDLRCSRMVWLQHG
jgi:hypothetical protein